MKKSDKDDIQTFAAELEQERIREIPVIDESVEDDIDYNNIMQGPLAFDRRNIKPGYQTKFVGDTPGSIAIHQKLGYEVVIDQFNVGDNTASKISRFGSAVTVQSACGMLLVLMQISNEKFNKFQAWKDQQSAKQIEGIGYSGVVPENARFFNGVPLSQLKKIDG